MSKQLGIKTEQKQNGETDLRIYLINNQSKVHQLKRSLHGDPQLLHRLLNDQGSQRRPKAHTV